MDVDRDYALFARIVAAGSLSGAARVMRLSPAMISKRLARLEARLGAQLIRRTTRRMELTEAGARFHRDVLAILAAIEEAEARISGAMREPAGTLRLSAPTSFGRLHVAPLLGPFLAAFPKVEVALDLSDDFTDLLAERIDLAIRITDGANAGPGAERLTTSRRILCAAPAYLARRKAPRTIADLPAHRLLAARGQMPWRLADGGSAVTVAGESFVATNSSEVVRELALAGVGIALRSLWDIGQDLAAGRLVRVLPQMEGSADVGIFAVQPRTARSPASVTAFVALLRATFQPVPPWEAHPAPPQPVSRSAASAAAR